MGSNPASRPLDRAGAGPADALMVGDSIQHDVDGALRAGLRAALLHRESAPHPRERELLARGVPVIGTLHALPDLLVRERSNALVG